LPLPTGQLAPAIPWVGAALPLCAATFLAKLDGAYALILLGPLGSDVELGIFRVALACVTLVGMPATVLHVVLAPRLAELVARDDRAELSGLLWRVSLVLLGCMIPGTLLIALWGEPLLTLAFGAPYAPAATPLLLLAIAQTLFAAFGMGPILLAMGGGERTLIRIYLVAVGAGMLFAVPLIILFGASGAAGAQIVSLGLIGTQCWFFARRRWGVDLTCFGLVRPQLS
jgi:O-antigen/teichoic acid export membrane protein